MHEAMGRFVLCQTEAANLEPGWFQHARIRQQQHRGAAERGRKKSTTIDFAESHNPRATRRSKGLGKLGPFWPLSKLERAALMAWPQHLEHLGRGLIGRDGLKFSTP